MVKKGKNQYWGFTLIELLTVIVILGLILLITIPIIFKI
ncbi:MAG TPA: prepilin-type N-terminal cleavage/methylation domain-containing protein, partial [Mollicutes bacterium]|nr:prepilin-type N-terminal cleavage/methylation domain-containing protein [Mollicutes bacterium]